MIHFITNEHIGKLILRLTVGGLMIFHGTAKLINGIGGMHKLMENHGLPSFIAYGVYLGEVVAPLLLIVGFRSRFASLFVISTMLVAIFLAHFSDILTLGEGGGWGIELQALYLFGATAILFLGSGKYAVSSSNTWD